MRKKAQGLSITTIIVAAIALIVLVVIIAIFTGRLGVFSGSLGKISENDCKDIPGARCIGSNEQCKVDEVRAFGKTGCLAASPNCCIPAG